MAEGSEVVPVSTPGSKLLPPMDKWLGKLRTASEDPINPSKLPPINVLATSFLNTMAPIIAKDTDPTLMAVPEKGADHGQNFTRFLRSYLEPLNQAPQTVEEWRAFDRSIEMVAVRGIASLFPQADGSQITADGLMSLIAAHDGPTRKLVGQEELEALIEADPVAKQVFDRYLTQFTDDTDPRRGQTTKGAQAV